MNELTKNEEHCLYGYTSTHVDANTAILYKPMKMPVINVNLYDEFPAITDQNIISCAIVGCAYIQNGKYHTVHDLTCVFKAHTRCGISFSVGDGYCDRVDAYADLSTGILSAKSDNGPVTDIMIEITYDPSINIVKE